MPTERMLRRGLAALLLVAGACGSRDAAFNQPLAIDGPHKVDHSLLWVDTTRGRLFALDADAAAPTVRTAPLPTAARYVTPTPARDALCVLTPGHDALHPGEPAEPPQLTVVHLRAGAAPDTSARYPIGSPFDRLAVSPDGKTAIAYFSAGASTNGYFQNPNEIAVVDLSAPPVDKVNPQLRTLRSLGAAPLGILFSPPIAIPATSGGPRRLAVVLAPDYLSFLDLDHLASGRPDITVPLVPSGSDTTVTPEQVLFDPAGATAYVRAAGSADVFALALEGRATTDATENDFAPHINQPSAGKVAVDMMLFQDGGRSYVLTADQSEDLAVIDAATSEFHVVSVGAPIDSILPLPPEAPTVAVLYSRSQPQSFVHFLALKDLASKLEQNLTRRTLAKPVHQLVPIPGATQLLVVHDDYRTVVSILDVGPRRSDTPIFGQIPLESFDFVGDASASYLVAVSSGLSHLGILDLATLEPLDVRLDFPPQRVFALGAHVVVDHGLADGLVTVLPSATAPREQAQVLAGFFLGGVLDDEPPASR